MAGAKCILVFTLGILTINLVKAQLIPGYSSTLYRVPTNLDPRLKVYSPQIPAARLPATPALGRLPSVGLPLLSKLPNGLPQIPRLPAPALPAGTALKPLTGLSKLLLTPSPLTPRISPLQVRSTNIDINAEGEKPVKAIDPLNEVSDDDPKIVISSTSSNNTALNNVHQTKIRSPDNNVEDLDFLSKAANPDDNWEHKLGHAVKEVGKGIKHAAQKIDSTFFPSHAHSGPKEAQTENGYVPFQTWAQNYRNDENSGRFDTVSDIMNAYRKVMNNDGAVQYPQFQVPENIQSDLRNRVDDFKQTVSDSKLIKNAKEYFEKFNNNRNNYEDDPFNDTPYNNKEASPVNNMYNNKFSDDRSNNPTNPNYSKSELAHVDNNNNPIKQFFNSASKVADNIKDVTNSASQIADDAKNDWAEFYQKNNPQNFWEKAASWAGNFADYSTNPQNNQFYGNPSYNGYQGFYPNEKTWNSAADMVGKVGNMATNPKYYGNYENNQMFNPYYQPYGAKYYPGNNPMGSYFNSASNLPQLQYNNRGQYYKRSPSTETSSVTVPTFIFTYGSTSQPVKRSNSFGSLINSATGLAGSITNAAMNPGQFGSGQILKSTGDIWGSATNLAGDIGNFATSAGSVGSGSLLGSAGWPLNTVSSLASNIAKAASPLSAASPIINTATNLAGNIVQAAARPLPDMSRIPSSMSLSDTVSSVNNPIQSIWGSANDLADNIAKSAGNLGNNEIIGSSPMNIANSATDLASQITNMALNPGNAASSNMFNPTSPSGTVLNRAMDMAGNIVNAAANPWSYNGQTMQSYYPTYAGGYYPRSSAITPIWNSANQLADSFVGNPAVGSGYNMYPSAVPFSNSAMNLAGNIANAAYAYPAYGVRIF